MASTSSFSGVGSNSLLVNAYCTHDQQLQDNAPQVCLGQGDSVLLKPGLAIVAGIVEYGAIFGLMVSCFTSLMGQPRIFYRMSQDGLQIKGEGAGSRSQDGLWFPIFAEIDPASQVPRFGIKITGVMTAFLACFVPLDALANLISLGTLMVFTFVNAGVILLRVRTQPETATTKVQSKAYNTSGSLETRQPTHKTHHRDETSKIALYLIAYTVSLTLASIFFTKTTLGAAGVICLAVAVGSAGLVTSTPKSWSANNHDHHSTSGHEHQFSCPLVPAIPLAGIACNAFMMGSLPGSSWIFCSIWLVIGVAFYFWYGIHHSKLQHNDRYAETTPLVALSSYPHEDMSHQYKGVA